MRGRLAWPLIASAAFAEALFASSRSHAVAGVRSSRPASAKAAATRATDRIYLTRGQLAAAYASGLIDRPVRSILKVPHPLTYGEFVWDDRGVPSGPVWVRVDLESQLISVFRAGHEIGTAVVLYGAERKQTPRGIFPILAKDRDHRSSTYGNAPMPYALRLTGDGVSIHGSNVRWGYATHGCIGVPLDFARRLFSEVHKGDQVVILSSSGTG